MGISLLVPRIATYYKRHGFRATAQRATLAVTRSLFRGRQVVFYCDLAGDSLPQAAPGNLLRVERKRSYRELSPLDLHEMLSFWNPTLAQRNIDERLDRGACLWLIKSEERLAGYGWTLHGRTIAPHYIPLGPQDVHLFDFYVFPQYRGRGINPFLVTHILRSLAADFPGRAYIEAAEWNEAQLASLAKTPFRRLGYVRKFTVLGKSIIWWDEPRDLNSRCEQQEDELPFAVPRQEQFGATSSGRPPHELS